MLHILWVKKTIIVTLLLLLFNGCVNKYDAEIISTQKQNENYWKYDYYWVTYAYDEDKTLTTEVIRHHGDPNLSMKVGDKTVLYIGKITGILWN